MKLTLKILGILIVLILALMVLVPYFFRDQIVEKIKEEINKNVNAQVDFTGFNLSLFRSFPDFNFRLSGLSVINNHPFAGDTLAYIPQLSLTIDLKSVFKGDAYVVKKVNFDQPVVNLLVNEEGLVNWDIAIEGDEETTAESADDTDMVIELRRLTINNGRVIYDDKSLVTYVHLDGLNHRLSGDFTMESTTIKTHTTIDEVTVFYDNVRYLHKIEAELDAPVHADLKNYIFTFDDSELRLNNFFLLFEGTFAMLDNGDYSMMITYSSKRTDFKDYLSLVPAIYTTDFDGLKTSGNGVLNGNVKGIYSDDSYPGFELNLLVNNGRFQYPELPASVDEINLQAKISFPGGGDFDALIVNVPNFSMFMAGNPFVLSMYISNPVSDMFMKGDVDGTINLSKVHEFYPLEEGERLRGIITTKLMFEGNMSAIENERYDDFRLMGSLLMDDFLYTSSMLNKPVDITKAQLNFSPQTVDLINFKMKIGDNDFSATGKVEGFIPYVLNDGTLKGNLQTNSSYFDVSSLLSEDEEPTTTEPDTTSLSVIEIPQNIDFTMQSTFETLMYDDIEFKNVEGNLMVKNQAVVLDNLNMEVLDGTILMSGKYDTKEPAMPVADFDMNINGIDIQQAYATFGTIEKYAPIAEKSSGKFSAGFQVNTLLDKEMMPVYASMNGGGNLSTTDITIENVNTFNKLADLLKMPDLKRLRLDPINLSFEFIDGKVHIQPFDIKYQDINANVLGWSSFEQIIDFDMVLTIPRAKFGGAANAVLDNLVNEANRLGTNFSLGDNVNIHAKITGPATDPSVRITPGDASGGSMLDDLKKKAQDELDRQKEKLEERAREELDKHKADAKKKADQLIADADRQATKIIDEAQKQADAINRTARETADKLIDEAEKQATKLEEEAKKRGPIAEIAGKKAAEQVRTEGGNQAEQLVNEAKSKSDSILREARNQANNIKANAQKEADDLLEK